MDRPDPQHYKGATPYPARADKSTQLQWLEVEINQRERAGDIGGSWPAKALYWELSNETALARERQAQQTIESQAQKIRRLEVQIAEGYEDLGNKLIAAMEWRIGKAVDERIQRGIGARIDELNNKVALNDRTNLGRWQEHYAEHNRADTERLAAELSTAYQPMMILPG